MQGAQADDVWPLLYSAWLIALGSTLAALFIGEVMGQAPCDLCWFQRAFMFPLAVVLSIAILRSEAGVWLYGLPLAAIGLVIAAFHSLQYAGLIPTALVPCSISGPSCSGSDMTILGGLPIPMLSLGSFAAILILLALIRRRLHS